MGLADEALLGRFVSALLCGLSQPELGLRNKELAGPDLKHRGNSLLKLSLGDELHFPYPIQVPLEGGDPVLRLVA